MANIHVTPLGDLIEHDTSGENECMCGPRYELVESDVDGSDQYASLDGRELSEPGYSPG